MSDIKVINWKDRDKGKQLAESFKNIGFAIITNHGIQEQLIKSTYEEWSKFFEKYPKDHKDKFLFKPEEQAGYFPMNSESAKDSDTPDIKEFYHYYPWADNPEGFINTAIVRAALSGLGEEVLEELENATPKDVTSLTEEPWNEMPIGAKRTLFRIIHYPPFDGSEPEGAVRAAAHGDINLLTLLPMATAEGLQVKDTKGSWHDVKCDDPNSIVVNVGDMLELASNNYYPSTVHRVVNPSNNTDRRYSMPLFLHPRCDVRLSGNKTADQFLKQRLKELGLI